VFADDFSSADLDPRKWQPSNRPDVIRPADGHLLLSARPGAAVDQASLLPTTLLRPFSGARFSVTITTYATGGPGEVEFVVNPAGEQPQVLSIGASPSGAKIYPLTCDAPPCHIGVYDDFTPQGNIPAMHVAYDEPIAIEVVRRDGHLQFFANGSPVGATEDDPGPLTGFQFSATSGPAESWDVKIDDLVLQ
jgi:hypothetical protein